MVGSVLGSLENLLVATTRVLRDWTLKRTIASFVRNGRRPWTAGYLPYRNRYIAGTLRDPRILNLFRTGRTLEKGFGRYLDERVVEYPWLLSRLDKRPCELLDAGSALNHEFLLKSDELSDKRITIITLEPEPTCLWTRRISYLFCDLRNVPLASGLFDIVTCISTIEHVGMDNTMLYSSNPAFLEKKTDDWILAIKEMRRLLKEGGHLLVSVPFGKRMSYGYYQQFDQTMVDRLISSFNGQSVKETYFCYEDGRWDFADRLHCASFEGFNFHASKYASANNALDYDPDFAACSRAIAALELVK